MQNSNFCTEEELLYSELISVLEWRVQKPDNALFNDFFPVMVSGRQLIKLDSKLEKVDYKKYITFKPLKNNKHCQFLVERLYEESDVDELIVVKEGEKKYGAKILQSPTEEVMMEISGCDTETEAKFTIICMYFIESEGMQDTVNVIKEFDEKHNPKVDVKEKTDKANTLTAGQQKALKMIQERLGKKFTGKTFKGAQRFIDLHFQDSVKASKNSKKK